MSLSIQTGTQALAPSMTTTFLAIGGTAPYTYSVQPGGAGGSINTGAKTYTAPNFVQLDPEHNIDTILVTDNVGATSHINISVLTALELVADILKNELDLDDDRVWLWGQKIQQPKDGGMYVVLQVMNFKTFGVANNFDDANNDEVKSVNCMATLSIDIKSRSAEAMYRKEEVVLALASSYAQRQQLANAFYIAQLPSNILQVPEEDGSAIPYRFNFSLNIQYTVSKRNSDEYYSDFSNGFSISKIEP